MPVRWFYLLFSLPLFVCRRLAALPELSLSESSTWSWTFLLPFCAHELCFTPSCFATHRFSRKMLHQRTGRVQRHITEKIEGWKELCIQWNSSTWPLEDAAPCSTAVLRASVSWKYYSPKSTMQTFVENISWIFACILDPYTFPEKASRFFVATKCNTSKLIFLLFGGVARCFNK